MACEYDQDSLIDLPEHPVGANPENEELWLW